LMERFIMVFLPMRMMAPGRRPCSKSGEVKKAHEDSIVFRQFVLTIFAPLCAILTACTQ
jgi:hypothetical protein